MGCKFLRPVFFKKNICMMKFFLIVVCVFTSIVSIAQKGDSSIYGKEPKLQIALKINNKNYKVYENEELKINEPVTNPAITVKISDYKTFENAAYSFDYPKNMSYEYSREEASNTWTLNGNSLNIIVFELEAKVPTDLLINEMIDKFGKENCKTENAAYSFGNKKCAGRKLNISLAGQKLVLFFYELVSAKNKSGFIAFQDSLTDTGESSEEYRKVLSLVESTFKFK